MHKLIALISLLLSLSSFADFCTDNEKLLGKLPIQQNGRVKPLIVHSNEIMKYMLVKSPDKKQSFLSLFCQLSNGKSNDLYPRIEHTKLRSALNLVEKSNKLSFEQLAPMVGELKLMSRKIKENNAHKKAIDKLINQISLYQNIKSGSNWLIPLTLANKTVDWVSFSEIKSQIPGQPQLLTALKNSLADYSKNIGNKYLIEFYYFKANLPVLSLFITMIALAFLTLFKKPSIGLMFAGLTILVQTILIAIRVYLSGRAPITNMYETVLFSGYGALFLAMVIGHLKKDTMFVYIGLIYNFSTLMMLHFATGMLSSSIAPLVPVLRDNFWLSTHVTIIIMSYGALALSWVLANHVIIKNKFSKTSLTKKETKYYSDLIYSCLKYGTVFLAAGILLGGVWADYSWGRFWGWDPKETWSLIVLCAYMAILHGRYTSWIKPSSFFHLCAGAFMSVMMAWFGVNYILAEGLHSYGFSEGGAIFLGSFFAIQITVLLITIDWKSVRPSKLEEVKEE